MFPILPREVPTLRNGDISRDGKTIVIHCARGSSGQTGRR